VYPGSSLGLEGDVGTQVAPGKGRQFSWQMLRDFPRGLSADVQVSVRAGAKPLHESTVAQASAPLAAVFERVERERLDVAALNRDTRLDAALRERQGNIEELLHKNYIHKIDPNHWHKVKYHCARFREAKTVADLDRRWDSLKHGAVAVGDADAPAYLDCLLASLDPHSSYLSPEKYRELLVGTRGSFGGVGMELGQIGGRLTVVTPLEDTPAHRAGVQAGDRIIHINGEATDGMTLVDAVGRLRGEKGTRVTISVLRAGRELPLDITMVRDVIQIRSVRYRALEDSYGYVRISQFQENTDEALDQAIAALRSQQGGTLRGLVLDLRNDPGGLLNKAVQVAGRFIGERLVVYTDGQGPGARQEFPGVSKGVVHGFPVAVLINGGSASASEIVAGALQDHKRAAVVGSRSFGKGTVQTVIPLAQDAAVKITTAGYYTPGGRSIQQLGITPDVPVDDAISEEGAIKLAKRLMQRYPDLATRPPGQDAVSQILSQDFTALFENVVQARVSVGPPAAVAVAAPAAGKPSADTTPPVITLATPELGRNLRVEERGSALRVAGQASDSSGIAEVRINDLAAALDESGRFSGEVLLRVGDNAVTVTALDTRGNQATRRFTVKRSAPVAAPAASRLGAGRYYALLIAVQDYANPEINPLEHPIGDASRLRDLLASQYTFDPANILFLRNPSRKEISKAFNDLRGRLTEEDSLLVFYAGHGIWMEDMKEGYWLPRDASGGNDPTDWVPNSTIRNYIRALKARHVLLVADACFAGGIFKVRDAFAGPKASIEKIYEMPSRKAITSGSLKTVPDRSVFVEYLTKRLKDNREKYLDAQKLFVSFKEAVINNSPNNQTPLYGAINEAGDEGGDFVFVRR
jgi:carboxyl-terminal processing protease